METSRILNYGDGSGEKVMDSRDVSLKQTRFSDQLNVGKKAEGRWQGSQSSGGRQRGYEQAKQMSLHSVLCVSQGPLLTHHLHKQGTF